MADANGLAILPDGDGVRAGARVQVMLIDPAAMAELRSPYPAAST
jgi:hypothetical protein